MTIAVGIICEDGIVLSSDSKYRTGGTTQYGEKIFPVQCPPWLRMVVAGVGAVGFIKAAVQKIEGSILPLRKASLLAVVDVVAATHKEFFENTVIPNRYPADTSSYGLLIAIAHESGKMCLLHTTENATSEVKSIQLEGTGGLVAEPYKGLWRKNIPAFEAELASIFMVNHAKTYDSDNCGGDTRVFTLLDATTLFSLEEEYVRLGERYFKEFQSLSLQMLMPSETGDLDEALFRGDLKRIVEQLQHHRDELNRYHPHAYRVVGGGQ